MKPLACNLMCCTCLTQFGAAQLNKVNFSNGDLAISNNAYFAMVDTVVGTLKDKSRGFKKDFNRLCSSSADPSIAEGCAMMAFNFDGENSRDISNYFYQVKTVYFIFIMLVGFLMYVPVAGLSVCLMRIPLFYIFGSRQARLHSPTRCTSRTK